MSLRRPTTREMSDAHEAEIQRLFGGRITRGSGNQWANQTDVRQHHRDAEFAFAFDGKSTLGASLSVSIPTWQKLQEQAGNEYPALPLMFWDDYKLRSGLHLVCVEADRFAAMLDVAKSRAER